MPPTATVTFDGDQTNREVPAAPIVADIGFELAAVGVAVGCCETFVGSGVLPEAVGGGVFAGAAVSVAAGVSTATVGVVAGLAVSVAVAVATAGVGLSIALVAVRTGAVVGVAGASEPEHAASSAAHSAAMTIR